MHALIELSGVASATTASGSETGWLTTTLLEFTRGGAEWVLWILVFLSLASIAAMIERGLFYRRHRVNAHDLRNFLLDSLDAEQVDRALEKLKTSGDSMEAHVMSYGLQHVDRGPRAVQELMAGALARERVRYDRYLGFLATLGNNAPFIGLFGTVLGVIQAFDGLRGLDVSDTAAAGAAVMGPIAEALIATGVGLLVAIPAVVAFNIFKGKVRKVVSNTELLARTMVAFLESCPDRLSPKGGSGDAAPGGSAAGR
ncbi:MAG: MotA/TolQ/ExbB proton channel family protein [Bradymonadales bacterium]|nr:MotA/TolQ/ExbB proton channel family protein [Bradymonadales bacterium]